VGFILSIASAASVVALIGVLWLLLVPYLDHLTAWYIAQLDTMDGHPCSAAALETREHNLAVLELGWNNVVAVFIFLGLAVNGMGLRLIRPAVHRLQVELSDA
jgi:hypothetical protein